MLIDIIRKDLKLILRSKTSTIAILLAPVLIVLLVGLAFSNSGSLQLAVGVVHGEEASTYNARLGERFTTYPFEEEQDCSEYVQRGILNACVVFTNDSARILVDPSNLQLVAAVSGAVQGTLAAQAQTEGLASADAVLANVVKSRYKLEQDLLAVQGIRSDAAQLATILKGGGGIESVDAGDLDSALALFQTAQSGGEQTEEVARSLLKDYRAYVESNSQDEETRDELLAEIDDIETQLDSIAENTATTSTKRFSDLITNAKESIESSNEQQELIAQQAAQAAAISERVNTNAAAVAASLQENAGKLGTIRVTEQSIVSPLAIDVTPVTAETDNFGFVFQFFFILIVMFSAILLGSSIVVRERSSRAYFRNVASPTPDYVFAAATFLSVLLIILFQTGIIYLASVFLSSVNLLSNIVSAVIVIILVAAIFTLIGMAIGYLMRTQEASIVGSITATCIFLCLSPVILPLETLPGIFRFLANANPFVIGAELLKNTVLFHFGIFSLSKVLVLLLYGVILAGGIFVLQRLTRAWVFERKTEGTIADFVAGLDIQPEKYLVLGSRTIKNKEQLLYALRTMDDEEFENYVDLNRNLIADWIEDVYKDHKLAATLRNKNKAGHIHFLEKR